MKHIQQTTMKTETEIAEYLQALCGKPAGVDRPLVISIGLGCYGEPSSAIIEVEGSPPKGMAIVRSESPLTDDRHVARPDAVVWQVWVLGIGQKLQKLRNDSHMAISILKLASKAAQKS